MLPLAEGDGAHGQHADLRCLASNGKNLARAEEKTQKKRFHSFWKTAKQVNRVHWVSQHALVDPFPASRSEASQFLYRTGSNRWKALYKPKSYCDSVVCEEGLELRIASIAYFLGSFQSYRYKDEL